MAEKRQVTLTRLVSESVSDIHEELQELSPALAEEFMDDFLDVVFDEIPRYPLRFPVCEGIKSGSAKYRIASLKEGFRVIYQVFADKVLILLILHESELPF